MTPKVSIADVAKAAGVSPTTVSHALSGRRSVSEATRAKVLRVVGELNYRPDRLASGMRHQRTHAVALLVVDIANPYYPAVVRGATNVLGPAGYVSHIGNTDGDRESELEHLAEMIARKVDGVIINALSLSPDEIREVVGPDLPLVLLGEPGEGELRADHVSTDDAQGVSEAVAHLVQRGVRDVGFISGPPGQPPGAGRLAAFTSAAQEAGLTITDSWVRHGTYTREGGRTEAAELLDLETPPRAIMCANDLIAIGALDSARQRGARVPDELMIIGFDNIETAELMSPGLTTIDNPGRAVGEACGRALVERMALRQAQGAKSGAQGAMSGAQGAMSGAHGAYSNQCLPTTLVVRETA